MATPANRATRRASAGVTAFFPAATFWMLSYSYRRALTSGFHAPTRSRRKRNAVRFLRLRVGAWGPLAKALRYEWDSIQKVATGKRAVTPALALRVARFAGIPMDELLAGQWLSTRVCRHCGHPPEDFTDEETVVE